MRPHRVKNKKKTCPPEPSGTKKKDGNNKIRRVCLGRSVDRERKVGSRVTVLPERHSLLLLLASFPQLGIGKKNTVMGSDGTEMFLFFFGNHHHHHYDEKQIYKKKRKDEIIGTETHGVMQRYHAGGLHKQQHKLIRGADDEVPSRVAPSSTGRQRTGNCAEVVSTVRFRSKPIH